MRKPRSDAILLNLPEEQQAKLADWLLSGTPYHEAKVLAEKEFGISLKSLSAFAEFWQQVCQPALLARRQRALGAAGQRAEQATLNPARFDEATLDAIKQKAYELAERPDASAKDVKAILMLVLKARDQDRQERELDLALEKYRDQVVERKRAIEAELGRAKANGGISAETREAIERELHLF